MSTKPTKEKKTLAGGKAVPSKVDKKPTKSAKADEDDDLEVDDEFKDIFNDSDAGFDDEDDDF